MRELAEWQRNFLKGLFYVSQDTEATRPGRSPRDAAAGAARQRGEERCGGKALCISTGTTETRR